MSLSSRNSTQIGTGNCPITDKVPEVDDTQNILSTHSRGALGLSGRRLGNPLNSDHYFNDPGLELTQSKHSARTLETAIPRKCCQSSTLP